MGDPKKTKKQYTPPRKPWDKTRLEEERALSETYGLKNKRELWRMETTLRNKRQNARKLLALPLEERLKREKELLDSLNRIGLLGENATLDDVLSLTLDALCERRLQTLVWRKGLANTVNQARQFITHGHISVNGKKVNVPGYIVPRELENKIAYYGKETLAKKNPTEKEGGKKSNEKDALEKKEKKEGEK